MDEKFCLSKICHLVLLCSYEENYFQADVIQKMLYLLYQTFYFTQNYEFISDDVSGAM